MTFFDISKSNLSIFPFVSSGIDLGRYPVNSSGSIHSRGLCNPSSMGLPSDMGLPTLVILKCSSSLFGQTEVSIRSSFPYDFTPMSVSVMTFLKSLSSIRCMSLRCRTTFARFLVLCSQILQRHMFTLKMQYIELMNVGC